MRSNSDLVADEPRARPELGADELDQEERKNENFGHVGVLSRRTDGAQKKDNSESGFDFISVFRLIFYWKLSLLGFYLLAFKFYLLKREQSIEEVGFEGDFCNYFELKNCCNGYKFEEFFF